MSTHQRTVTSNVIVEPNEFARDLREEVVDILGRDDSTWANVSPSMLAGHCYTLSNAYYYGLSQQARDNHVPQQVRFEINDPLFIGEVSHWFLKRSDGCIIDLTAEQFNVPDVSVPYDDARGRGFGSHSTPTDDAKALLIATGAI